MLEVSAAAWRHDSRDLHQPRMTAHRRDKEREGLSWIEQDKSEKRGGKGGRMEHWTPGTVTRMFKIFAVKV